MGGSLLPLLLKKYKKTTQTYRDINPKDLRTRLKEKQKAKRRSKDSLLEDNRKKNYKRLVIPSFYLRYHSIIELN